MCTKIIYEVLYYNKEKVYCIYYAQYALIKGRTVLVTYYKSIVNM